MGELSASPSDKHGAPPIVDRLAVVIARERIAAERERDDARALVTALRRHLLCPDADVKTIGVDVFDPRKHCSACRKASS